MLAIESLNRFECYFLNTMAAAAAYVRQVDHPNFKALFDTFHANIEEENLPKAFSEMRERSRIFTCQTTIAAYLGAVTSTFRLSFERSSRVDTTVG